jgi:glutamyl-tRNA reductase
VDDLLVIGLNQRAACLDLRERLAFNHDQAAAALEALLGAHTPAGEPICQEAVLLSTCNRSEIYIISNQTGLAQAQVFQALAARAGLPQERLEAALYVFRGEEAARHLLRVAAGLDSLVTGENEILGQVKSAYQAAHDQGATGPLLSALFRYAVQAGKRVRTETDLNKAGRSTATMVVELAEEMFGCLAERTALLIGAGKISALTARALLAAGLRCILVANRTYERAVTLAHTLNGQAVHFDCLDDSLSKADIVICSTGAPHIVLHQPVVEAAMQQRPNRPLLVADLAVPRDADLEIAHISGVRLADIDSLEKLVKAHHPLAVAVLQEAEAIVEAELDAYLAWRQVHRNAPIIRALTEKAEAICQEQVLQTLRRLGELTPEQQRAIEVMGQAIAGKLLHDPITWLRQPDTNAELIQALFGLASEKN